MELNGLENFYFNQPEPIQGCFLALREIILSHDNRISECLKYGAPCFCVGKKIICYLWMDKKLKEPYILVADGNLIDHPLLELGNRKRMKILRVRADQDIPVKEVQEVLQLVISVRVGS